MSILPQDAKALNVEGSTVDFYEFIKDKIRYVYFDSSSCSPPDPMVNAILGLELIKDDEKLIMVNHQIPSALLTKVAHTFDVDIKPLESGFVKLEFSLKT